MPPLTKVNQYPRRYRPYSRPITLHSTFPPERHSCASHSLFIVYPIDSDPTVFETPQPLVPRQAEPSAASYFASVSHEIPQIKIRKPPGEAGRPGAGRQGYSLSTVLKWPDEVYKEVQATIHKLATEDLPVATLANQEAEKLGAFYSKISGIYPYLQNYEKDWPTADFLRTFLKNRVQATRRT